MLSSLVESLVQSMSRGGPADRFHVAHVLPCVLTCHDTTGARNAAGIPASIEEGGLVADVAHSNDLGVAFIDTGNYWIAN